MLAVCWRRLIFSIHMRGPVKLSLSLIVLVAAGAGLLWTTERREPVAQGRTLSEWAMALQGPEAIAPAEAVIREFGVAGVPLYTRMLRTRDSLLKRPFERFAPRLPRRMSNRLWQFIQPELGQRKRLGGALALRVIGPQAAPAMKDLLVALREPEPNLCLTSSLALAQIGAASVPGLTDALSDPKPHVRAAAAHALGLIGPPAAPSAPGLIEALADPSVRPMALEALRMIGRPVVDPLVSRLSAADPRSTNLLEVLEGMGGMARPAMPVLLEWMTHPDPAIRLQALRALAGICRTCPAVREAMLKLEDDPDAEVRGAAIRFRNE
jgi:hypothetical protein